MVKSFSIEEMLQVYRRKGYKIPQNESKPYNLMLVGVRATDTTPNIFNDMIFWMYKYNGAVVLKQAQITTDPGLYYLEHPCNVNGTGIMKPGYYPGLWQIGLHQGKYEALVQIGNCTLIRDYDRDKELDYNSDREETGNSFGINCHHAGIDSTQIDNWSAGCQVFKKLADFDTFMIDCRKARDNWGNLFSYALLKESDFE